MMGFPANPDVPDSIESIAKDFKKDRLQKEDSKHKLEAAVDGLNLTHFGNGERFVAYYKDRIRYLPPFDWWYAWSDEEGRWVRDDCGAVQEMGKAVVRKIYKEASKTGDEDRRKALAKWAISCETPGSVSQMLEVAMSTPEIVFMPDTLDPDPFLINLRNGYYSFLDHRMHPHDKKHFFSMMIPVRYDGAAACPMWKAFLDRMFQGKPEKDALIGFLQRAVGYTLTGDTSERAIFLMHGLGANGKTVFIRILEALFGDYGAAVSSSTFTTAMSTNVRNDLARLRGKRFVWASENSSDTILDEETIKRVSGGDTITCRFLFKEEFQYRPAFKIWWVFNHKPRIRDATDSIWDRIHLVPCEERIPLEEQDKHLTEKLLVELPGIFNWAIDGYFKYCRDGGLKPPAAVKEATQDYRRDEDVLSEFLQECFETVLQQNIDGLMADDRMPFKTLWQIWAEWAGSNGEKPRSKTWMGRQLDSRFKKYRTNKEKGYLGIQVKRG
jgi:putative DNA primase/helicase